MSCLFNSLAKGIKNTNGAVLRKEICDYLDSGVKIEDTSVEDLILWTENLKKDEYIA